jgi:hypothetical protein
MTFPNVADVLADFTEMVILKKVTQIINSNFLPENVESTEAIHAVVQSANSQTLKIEPIDYSLEYIQVHSVYDMDINDIIIWNNKSYKLISFVNQSNRGFYEVIGEEIK